MLHLHKLIKNFGPILNYMPKIDSPYVRDMAPGNVQRMIWAEAKNGKAAAAAVKAAAVDRRGVSGRGKQAR